MSVPKYILTIENATVLEVQDVLQKSNAYIELKDKILVEVVNDTEDLRYTFDFMASRGMKDVFFDEHYSTEFIYTSCSITTRDYSLTENTIISLCKELQLLLKTKVYLFETNTDLLLIFE